MFFNINFKLKYAGESINIDEILENVDTDKFGKKKAKHYIRYRTKNIYNTYFKDESVTTQAQLLLSLLKSRKLKEATSLLGIQKSKKDTKVQHNVFNNITGVLKSFGKSRKENVRVARKTLQTTIVSGSNIKDRLTRHMAKNLGTSRKTLHKHRKFCFQIDVNDELACWTMISRQPYKDRLAENVKELARNCWLENVKYFKLFSNRNPSCQCCSTNYIKSVFEVAVPNLLLDVFLLIIAFIMALQSALWSFVPVFLPTLSHIYILSKVVGGYFFCIKKYHLLTLDWKIDTCIV
jgi:hypothetical protein